MNDTDFRHVTIVGVGLLGGSTALALKAYDPRIRVAGVGRRQSSLDEALNTGAIDTAHLDVGQAVADTDLVVLATPVRAFEEHLRAIKPVLHRGTIITDVGSTKAGVVRMARRVLGADGAFVGSHPMAGSEAKGVAFARADLFFGATCILTPIAQTPARVVTRAETLWRMLGMQTVRMTPWAHDRALARVSHLPHALAALLMTLPSDADLDVSATGFRDATRLASGDPEMWRDIFVTNRKAVLAAIGKLGKSIDLLRDLLERGDAAGIERFLAKAKTRRDATIARVLHDRRIAAE